jgi:hypothetical protein
MRASPQPVVVAASLVARCHARIPQVCDPPGGGWGQFGFGV